jgi:hypothetical protein
MSAFDPKRTYAPRSQQLRLHDSGRDLATNEFAADNWREAMAKRLKKKTQKITVEVEASSRAAAVTKLRRIMAKAGVTKKSKIGQTVLVRRA